MDYTQEKERQSLACVSTPAKLRKRLNDARSCLIGTIRTRFSNPTLDFNGKRLLSNDGTLALQWRLRDNPNAPESYENQQTNRGTVYCVEARATDKRQR